MRAFWLFALCLGGAVCFAQNIGPAEQVYKGAQDSVFLVYLNDSNGNPTAFGSAFLVAPNLLVTNAHVIEGGSPVLAVGPVRLPLKTIRVDRVNDLAILSGDLNLTSKPLTLSGEEPRPGEQVFALGNPEGLEKTLSQGIVSGIRTHEGRNLIQITSPISHGSSGGPILNDKGEVVGVAVGMLEDGQNLNFAVPVKYVRELLEHKSEQTSTLDCSDIVAQLTQTLDARGNETYSEEASSKYQELTRKLKELSDDAATHCRTPTELERIACIGTKAADLSEYGIRAARTLVNASPTPTSRSLLAYVLYDRAQYESINAAFAKDGSVEKANATRQYTDFLGMAQTEASTASKVSKGNDLMVADYVLGEIRGANNDYAGAIALESKVAQSNSSTCGVDLASNAFRSLIADNNNSNNAVAAETWFRLYASKYEPAPYEWDSEGDRRAHVGDFSSAADAYERAADKSNLYKSDYCYAAVDRDFQTPPDKDAVISDGRKCIDASVRNTDKDSQKQFDHMTPQVYRVMADVLESRGVYDQALQYVKEALSSSPDDAFALDTEAKIFEDLQRYSECISAAQAAVRLSDGKYTWMQFRLGDCYFDTENWVQAANNFRLVAEADKSDPVSAFNLALALSRQGYSVDANEWFREALHRNPDSELRAKILNALR